MSSQSNRLHDHNRLMEESIPARYIYKGSMTVETAFVLPIFVFVMLAILQFASLQLASSALLSSMQETAKQMAEYAYVQDIGIGTGGSLAGDIVAGGISAVYAKGKIEEMAGNAARGGSLSLLQSSFLTDEMIDIVGTYQRNSSLTILPIKKVKARVRTRVRAWTGREGRPLKRDDAGTENESEDEPTVFVTQTGSVYHTDPNCTHIRLSISTVSKASISTRRNRNGAKYHACEKCGAAAGSSVYITKDGNRYHSSLECSGLKRTVKEYKLSEVEGMRICSRCGGKL